MNNKIIIINGPNINLLGEREQSQYGSISFENLKKTCLDKIKELSMNGEFFQSNIEGEIVNKIQEARKSFDGIIINDLDTSKDSYYNYNYYNYNYNYSKYYNKA